MIKLQNILVATDFSEPSEAAVLYGRELAERFNATLHVLHVVQPIPPTAFGVEAAALLTPEVVQEIEDDARRRLHAVMIDSDGSGPNMVAAIRTATDAATQILDYAKSHKINLMVLGTHGRGAFAHFMMGSVAERVVRLAPCPVLTVRHPEREFVQPDALVAVAGKPAEKAGVGA